MYALRKMPARMSQKYQYPQNHYAYQKSNGGRIMNFAWFVLPFSIGLLILFILVIFKFSFWIKKLSNRDRMLFNKGIFSRKLFPALGEIISESLFHRRIYKVNPLLGYMHMSFAFGWLMLIVIGNIESRLSAGTELNLPYYAIFFKYFETGPMNIPFENGFIFLMDFFLLYVLSGLMLALFKRIYSRIFGMRKTTRLKPFDVFALASLWLIFPLRLLAESFTSGEHHSGGFLTGNLGNAFAGMNLPLHELATISWWSYSFALGIFFVSLPYSRYMHIPSEILLIAFRRFGIRRKQEYDAIKDVEVFSCSRCGICIDKCQLASMAAVPNVQSAYIIKSIRKNNLREIHLQNCLLCGRCQEFCPVGIKTDPLRIAKRMFFENKNISDFHYIRNIQSSATDFLYFAGCMTHLTPAIKKAMICILKAAGDTFSFMDEDGSVCCGRPMMLSGSITDAQKLIRLNKEIIRASGAHTLITSCPICLRIFKEEYNLNIRIIHHSQYIADLLRSGRINISKQNTRISYHDPCELGRGLGIYDEPREVLGSAGILLKSENEKNHALCCGGSMGNNTNHNQNKTIISGLTVQALFSNEADIIATSCPLCKKTFAIHAGTKVKDVAELVAENMQ